MCSTDTPAEPVATPEAQTFATTDAFLAAIRPGMDLCTSDFTGWADIDSVVPATDAAPGYVVGTVREDGRTVHVPGEVLIDIRGGHCVRVDRVRATIDRQDWSPR